MTFEEFRDEVTAAWAQWGGDVRFLDAFNDLADKFSEVGMRTPDWQREHDSLLENVVRICLDSRKVDPERQAAHLRDELLTMCDPLMLVTSRIRAAAKEQPK